jgi:hypothetical protein
VTTLCTKPDRLPLESSDAATLQIVRVAAALYGLQLGAGTMQRLLQPAATQPDGVAGLIESRYAQDFAHLSPATVAAMVVEHLGLRAALEGLAEVDLILNPADPSGDLTPAVTACLQSRLEAAGRHPARALDDLMVELSSLADGNDAFGILGAAGAMPVSRLQASMAWPAYAATDRRTAGGGTRPSTLGSARGRAARPTP